jgi:hypothetical protein
VGAHDDIADYLEVNGLSVEVVERDGRLVVEVWRYQTRPEDLDERGRRKPGAWARGERTVLHTDPWLHRAVFWAIARTQGATPDERARILWALEYPGQPYTGRAWEED